MYRVTPPKHRSQWSLLNHRHGEEMVAAGEADVGKTHIHLHSYACACVYTYMCFFFSYYIHVYKYVKKYRWSCRHLNSILNIARK